MTATALLATASASSAGVITQSGSLPMQTTNWSADFNVDRFDDLGGQRVLQAVRWTVTGHLEGSAAAESIGASPRTITLDLAADISLSRDGSTLATASPMVSNSFDAGAFDGNLDFDGASGAFFGGLSESITVSEVADDLAPYIGSGQITLSGQAMGLSEASGGGNLASEFNTQASMEYEVVYEFLEIPAPGSIAIAGAAGLLLRRRRV